MLCVYGLVFLMTSLIIIPDETKSVYVQSRVCHSVFVIVECLVFGLFVLAVICEQITSVFSSKIPLNYENQRNLYENLKSNAFYKYSHLCKVFGKKNPILWLLPFEFDLSTKQTNVLFLV